MQKTVEARLRRSLTTNPWESDRQIAEFTVLIGRWLWDIFATCRTLLMSESCPDRGAPRKQYVIPDIGSMAIASWTSTVCVYLYMDRQTDRGIDR